MLRISVIAAVVFTTFGFGVAHAQEMAFGQPGQAEDVGSTIEVVMQDNAYSIQELTVTSGETVRFVLINKDDTDHEFNLGTVEMQAMHREMMAAMGEHAHMHDHGDAQQAMPNMVFVPANETRELIWTFAAGGVIEFACNIPGHYEAGMHGTIEIDEPR